MGKLILVRHGETIWNKEGRFQGQTDVGLSDKGIEQAKLVADNLSKYPVTAVYTSDLVRALKTAEVIAKKHDLAVKLDRRLREYSFGIWEGLTRTKIEQKYKELYLERQRNINVKIPGGESALELQRRVMEAISEICHNQSGVVVLVAHGGTIRIALASMLGMELTNAYKLMVGNTTLSIVHWELKHNYIRFMIETINNDAHLL